MSAMPMARTLTGTVALALFIAATPAAAQRGVRGAACGLDTTAAWYKSQKEFYSNPSETWSNDSLRKSLLAAAGYDPKSAFVAELGWRLDAGAGAVHDAAALALLRDMAQRRQWPTRALVGTAGVHAAWLIAQQDSALSVAAMRRMMEAGPGESSPAEVAVLDDARRVKIGRGQIHGTQFTKGGTGVVLAGRIEDSVHVDMRREGGWLPPIAVSACLAARAAGAK
jgi:hypothetical protein